MSQWGSNGQRDIVWFSLGLVRNVKRVQLKPWGLKLFGWTSSCGSHWLFFHRRYDFDSKRLESEFHHCAPLPRIGIKCSEMHRTADWLEGGRDLSLPIFHEGHQSSLFVLVNTVPFPQRSPNNSVCILNSPVSLHVFFIASIWLPPAAPSPPDKACLLQQSLSCDKDGTCSRSSSCYASRSAALIFWHWSPSNCQQQTGTEGRGWVGGGGGSQCIFPHK